MNSSAGHLWWDSLCEKIRLIAPWMAVAVLLSGIFFRFFRIQEPVFFFYDEALYLNHNAGFFRYMENHPPATISQMWRYLEICWHLALTQAKVIWFFLANLRAFILDSDALYFTRLISAVSGTLTLGVVYGVGRAVSGSSRTGLLAALLLAFLPSHVFYSRLGLQEAFSTLFFSLGVWAYVGARGYHWRGFAAGICWACVFLSNYRMIVLPVHIFLLEVLLSRSKRKVDWRRLCAGGLTFAAIVFLIGDLDDGANTRITFSWMFYQSHLAQGTFDWINLFSFPYYLIRFESFAFFLLLIFGLFVLIRMKEPRDDRWKNLIPAVLVLTQILIFSWPQEKGMRFICVVLPMAAVAVAISIERMWETRNKCSDRFLLAGIVSAMFMIHGYKINQILRFSSDSKIVVEDLQRVNPGGRIISSQDEIQRLYTEKSGDVVPIPKDERMMIPMLSKGYRYLVLGPQAYITYTSDGLRFSTRLKGFLNFVEQHLQPAGTYYHFSRPLLERFVMEHNENLGRSLRFLSESRDAEYERIRVYDLTGLVPFLKEMEVRGE